VLFPMLSVLPAQPEELARCPQKQKSDDVPFQKKLESATEAETGVGAQHVVQREAWRP